MNDQPKPVAINLMEIWLTGREFERPNALWRPCKRDNTPAADWRPMNRTVAKRAVRSGVFTVTHAGAQHLFCARQIPGTALQLTDYARLKELIGMNKRGEQLPALVLPEATEVPATQMPAMEDVYAPELVHALPTAPVITGGEDGAQTTDALNAAQLDAAADSVISGIVGGVPEGTAHPVGAAAHIAADDGAKDTDHVAIADCPTEKAPVRDLLTTDTPVSIPSVGNVADSTTDGYDSDKQPDDGDRASDRGSEVQSDARAD